MDVIVSSTVESSSNRRVKLRKSVYQCEFAFEYAFVWDNVGNLVLDSRCFIFVVSGAFDLPSNFDRLGLLERGRVFEIRHSEIV